MPYFKELEHYIYCTVWEKILSLYHKDGKFKSGTCMLNTAYIYNKKNANFTCDGRNANGFAQNALAPLYIS